MQLSLSSSIERVMCIIYKTTSRFFFEKLINHNGYPINEKQATQSAASSCAKVLCCDEESIYE